jgi:tetratricopeptide (TPR) repeat protein
VEARLGLIKFQECNMNIVLSSVLICLAMLSSSVAHADDTLTRAEALNAITQAASAQRLKGVERLMQVGTMDDTDAVLMRLTDPNPRVRVLATAALWEIWSRSGDAEVDALFAQGVKQMQATELPAALQTFTAVVQRQPDFAEGWNKRATVYFLMDELDKSLADCDEVLSRNPKHFGALSGAGQIHLKLDQPQKALDFLQRALEINPNLSGLERLLPMLEQQVRDKLRSSA